MSKILVVDDSPASIRVLEDILSGTGNEFLSARSAAEALDAVACNRPDVVILDIVLPDYSGLESFDRIRKVDPTVPVVFITATADSDTAIEAMRLGALDYLLKPLNPEKVREIVAQALQIRRFMHVPVRLSEAEAKEPVEGDALIGRCPVMQEVYKAIGRVAPQNIPVLIRGESGTGKELIARAICQHGPRSQRPFLAVNCAAIPETLLESELFGHEKGAFTGAAVRRIGKFEQCHQGTLFLDEVGDMTPLMQSKVLRVLQDKRFERVGGNETIESDVWIVAATNRDLEAMVAEGQFRADLYYRLNGYSIALPPLRERGEDIPLLVEHFLTRFARELGKDECRVSPDALELLTEYSWPGNVRELQSALKHAMIHATMPILMPEFLPKELQRSGEKEPAVAADDDSRKQPLRQHHTELADRPTGQDDALTAFIDAALGSDTKSLYADTIAYVERILLTRVLRNAGGNQSRAAQLLGITRGSLRRKVRTHGISINKAVDLESNLGDASD
jgi:two-component system nitrogen regulation response regulator GlnG